MKTIGILFIALICLSSFSAKIYPHSLYTIAADSVIEGKEYHVKAVVKKKLREQMRLIIKHERIKGFMPAMTMAFPVSDSLIFDSCAVGSKGIFTLKVEKGFPVITAAHFRKLPKYVCPMHPHELSNIPGSCPVCGMPLEKRK